MAAIVNRGAVNLTSHLRLTVHLQFDVNSRSTADTIGGFMIGIN